MVGDHLELEVRDFGPIGRAAVELRPLTVFVGPSNTGKSWLATLIYALHQYFNRSAWRRKRPSNHTYRLFHGPALEALDDQFLAELAEWNNRSLADLRHWSPGRRLTVPAPIADAIRIAVDTGADHLQEELAWCFGLKEPGRLVREGSGNDSRVFLRKRHPDQAQPLEHQLEIGREQLRLRVQLGHGEQLQLPPDLSPLALRDLFFQRADVGQEGLDIWAIMMLSELAGLLRPVAVSPLDERAYYLPSGRGELLHSRTLLLPWLLRGAATAAIRPQDASPLSGVAADFLGALLHIADTPEPGSAATEELASALEEKVLGGSARVEKNAGDARIAFRPRGWKRDLALTNASSMASDVAPVVLYLRYLADPGDLLIIEEPESSLHPAKQVAFLRGLAELAAAGVRVLLTTHSEWMVEELANVVRRSQLPPGDRVGVALAPEDVGAWLFRPEEDGAGSEVSEIGLDESGLYPTGFQEVAAALHNDWAEITSQIENAG